MTVANSTGRAQFTGTGLTSAFPLPSDFQFLLPGDLLVAVYDATTSTESIKVLNSHYSVSGGNGSNGTVTFLPGNIPAFGQIVTIIRDMDFTQELDLTQNDPLPADSVERNFGDRLVMLMQQLNERLSRTFQLAISSTGSAPSIVPGIANTALVYDATGTVLVPGPSATQIASAQSYAIAAAASAAAAASFNPALYLLKAGDVMTGELTMNSGTRRIYIGNQTDQNNHGFRMHDGSSNLTHESFVGGYWRLNWFDTSTWITRLRMLMSSGMLEIPGGVIIPGLNNSQIGGNRNALLNGSMNIWQRGTSFAIAAATPTYTADRWMANCASSGTTVLRSAGTAGIPYAARYYRDSGNSSTNTLFFAQSLESVDSQRFQGKIGALGFWARCGANYSAASSQLRAMLFTGTGTDQNCITGYTGQAVPVDQMITLTTSWQFFPLVSAAALASNLTEAGVQFRFNPTGTAGANDWFEVTGLQFEEQINTAFEFRRFGKDLFECQRYYAKTFSYTQVPAQAATLNGVLTVGGPAATGSTNISVTWQLPNTLRSGSPIIITYSPLIAGTGFRGSDGVIYGATAGFTGDKNIGIYTSVAGSAGTQRYDLHATADAEIY